MPKYNPRVKAQILEVVENQLREESLPEVKQTFDRLVAQGHSIKEAKRLIGVLVTYEIYAVLKSKKPFDRERYVAALQQLPKIPDDYDRQV